MNNDSKTSANNVHYLCKYECMCRTVNFRLFITTRVFGENMSTLLSLWVPSLLHVSIRYIRTCDLMYVYTNGHISMYFMTTNKISCLMCAYYYYYYYYYTRRSLFPFFPAPNPTHLTLATSIPSLPSLCKIPHIEEQTTIADLPVQSFLTSYQIFLPNGRVSFNSPLLHPFSFFLRSRPTRQWSAAIRTGPNPHSEKQRGVFSPGALSTTPKLPTLSWMLIFPLPCPRIS